MFFFHKTYLERTCDGFFSHLKIEFITIVKSWIFDGIVQHNAPIKIPSQGLYLVSKPINQRKKIKLLNFLYQSNHAPNSILFIEKSSWNICTASNIKEYLCDKVCQN